MILSATPGTRFKGNRVNRNYNVIDILSNLVIVVLVLGILKHDHVGNNLFQSIKPRGLKSLVSDTHQFS